MNRYPNWLSRQRFSADPTNADYLASCWDWTRKALARFERAAEAELKRGVPLAANLWHETEAYDAAENLVSAVKATAHRARRIKRSEWAVLLGRLAR